MKTFNTWRLMKMFRQHFNLSTKGKIVTTALVLLLAPSVWGQRFSITNQAENSSSNDLFEVEVDFPAIKEYFRNFIRSNNVGADLSCSKKQKTPPPPRLPRNFRWKGRYIVPDLVDPETGKVGVNVPFTWHGHVLVLV